jgi:DNA-binding protein YbaB
MAQPAGQPDFTRLRAFADGVGSQFDQVRREIAALRAEIDAVRATGRSRDGYVTATVGPRGQLIQVEFDPRIYRSPDTKALAEAVTTAAARAADEATKKVAAITEGFGPAADVRAVFGGDLESPLHRLAATVEQLKGETGR